MNKKIQSLIITGSLLVAGVIAMGSGPGSTGMSGFQPPPNDRDSEPVFLFTEEMATFQGGDIDDFRLWVQDSIKYPEEDLANNVFGRVTVQFAVNTEGKVYNVVILRGVTPTIDEEVKRVILSSPDWVPARQGGMTVNQQFTIPVVFSLTQ